ncbi:hypothetical protein CDAR_367431 [Caerostris darwini]|uniref:Uncharacterized protein n=1 Tax=Caerostris darwini TaxID=1538125 RepID=A0AAV4SGZ3_9ARAC|nr:hypothetical protein CDAR_367431 [Caerostris darwini]
MQPRFSVNTANRRRFLSQISKFSSNSTPSRTKLQTFNQAFFKPHKRSTPPSPTRCAASETSKNSRGDDANHKCRHRKTKLSTINHQQLPDCSNQQRH